MSTTTIELLLGKTFTSVTGEVGGELIEFFDESGATVHMHHQRDCCESVTVEDICGDLKDLEGSPILQAEESTSDANPEGVTKEDQESFTWTFYRLATIKGSVVIRWYGESNGYYSESVEVEQASGGAA